MGTNFSNWLDGLLLAGGGGAFSVAFISFFRRFLSRNNLDKTQFDTLSQTLTLVRDELERERQERVKERREWREYEANLKAEIGRLGQELAETRAKLEEVQATLERFSGEQP